MFNYEYPPLGGGAGSACENLLREFAKMPAVGIDLVTSSVDKFKVENFSPNIRIFYLNIGKKGSLHYQSIKDLLVYSWKSYFFSRQLIRNYKYDLIHAFFGIPSGFIAMCLRWPYIVSLRGSDVPFYSRRFKLLDKVLFKNLSRRIWKKSKAVIANSSYLKSLALRINVEQKIEVIPNGVDTKFFHPVDSKNDFLVILSTSRLIARKGLHYLIEGFKLFQSNFPESRLILAGEGDLKEELIRLAQGNQAIQFVGNQNKEALRDFYQHSDIFVLPSEAEGMSNSLLEAMASGLGLILSRAAGPIELVGPENALILPEISAQNICKALEWLARERTFLNQMKITNRKKAEEFSWVNATQNYLNIYKQYV